MVIVDTLFGPMKLFMEKQFPYANQQERTNKKYILFHEYHLIMSLCGFDIMRKLSNFTTSYDR